MARATKATAPMYISNPFEKPGAMALSLTSTHPPIHERIKILRGMAGSASFHAYDEAGKKVRDKKAGLIPQSALAADQAIPIRPPHEDDAADPRMRMREAGDLVRQINQFAFIACPCGIKIKIPPDYARPVAVCPRCQRKHPIPTAQGRP
jgi:heat shock protein HtpX